MSQPNNSGPVKYHPLWLCETWAKNWICGLCGSDLDINNLSAHYPCKSVKEQASVLVQE